MSARAAGLEAQLAGRKGRNAPGKVLELLLLSALFVCLLFLVVLLYDVIRAGMGLLLERRDGFLRAPLSSLPQNAGVAQGIAGSLFIAGFVAMLAFPLGIAAAVYLEEYAPDNRFTRFIVVNVRNLAGVPSIVYGLLGLALLVSALRNVTGGPSLMAGGITIAVLVLPIVIITASEALRSVPKPIREASFGLGATQWETIRHHVLPSAAPGILTGTVLALSRALGETAPLLLVGAVTGFLATGEQSVTETLQGPFTSLPTIIFSWARQPNVGFRELTAAAICVLLIVIIVCNAAAIYLRNRYERKW
jgi:phosphate transport system permease protein